MTQATSAKDQLRRIADDLPDDATWEDVQYQIYVHESIERGLADSLAGRRITSQELLRQLGLEEPE